MALRTTNKPLFVDFEGIIGEWVSDTVPPTAYSDFLEIESIDITMPEQTTVKLIGRRTSTLGTAIDSQNRANDSVASVAIKTNTFSPALLALAMGGSVVESTQSAGAVALDTVTTLLNIWVPLSNYSLAPHDTGTEIVLKTSADVTVASTKYEIDAELGMIRATHADAVGVGMKVSYYKDARTWEDYNGGGADSQYVHITGKATNTISGKVGLLNIWRANLAPDTSFMVPSGEKHFQGSFKGDLIVPTVAIRGATRTKPYQFLDRV